MRMRTDARRAARAGRVLAINAGLLLLLVGAAEGLVRVLTPFGAPAGTEAVLYADSVYVSPGGVSPGPRRGARGRTMGVLRRVDGDGFWRTSQPVTPGDSAWLWLGDSVTMGIGVDEDSTFAARLDDLRGLRTRNAALVGYGTADYRRALEDRLAEPGLPVRRVTVAWCLNDATPRGAGPEASLRRWAGGPLAWLAVHSAVYRAAKATLLDRPLLYYTHDRAFYADPARLAPALRDLRAMRDAARRAGVPLDVVVLPYEAQLRLPGADSLAGDRLPQRVLGAALARLGIPATDVTDRLARYPEPSALFLPSDGIHFSAAGHAAVAEAVRAANARTPDARPSERR